MTFSSSNSSNIPSISQILGKRIGFTANTQERNLENLFWLLVNSSIMRMKIKVIFFATSYALFRVPENSAQVFFFSHVFLLPFGFFLPLSFSHQLIKHKQQFQNETSVSIIGPYMKYRAPIYSVGNSKNNSYCISSCLENSCITFWTSTTKVISNYTDLL